jgi:hypothetical protein
MKKIMMLLVVLFGFSSLASAQDFSAKVGIAYNFGSGIGANLSVRTPNLVKFSSDLGLGVRVDFKGDFSSGFAGFASVSPVINFGLGGQDYLYFGLSAGLAFAGGNAVFTFGLDAGDVMYLTKELAWYLDVKLLFVPSFLYFANLGLSYDLSKQLALFFEVQGARAGDGIGLGLVLGAILKF